MQGKQASRILASNGIVKPYPLRWGQGESQVE